MFQESKTQFWPRSCESEFFNKTLNIYLYYCFDTYFKINLSESQKTFNLYTKVLKNVFFFSKGVFLRSFAF